ncbi:hypothetical protein [Mycolicibacterium sp. P1-18]|uniref:hypothetical protein n=1 Tax=Mycolicibacterium sp. P1-18 TaxID=2024615 RepID=UPI0011F3FFE1|nr:hypothetical protein [Mycolicibacterium sp. P1-18]
MFTSPSPEGTPEQGGRQKDAGVADVGATVMLLFAHTGLLLLSLLIATMMSMGEPCPPPGCYGEARTTVAIVLISLVAGLVFLADLVLAVVLMAQRRRAARVPAFGCLTQVVLIAAALVIAS